MFERELDSTTHAATTRGVANFPERVLTKCNNMGCAVCAEGFALRQVIKAGMKFRNETKRNETERNFIFIECSVCTTGSHTTSEGAGCLRRAIRGTFEDID